MRTLSWNLVGRWGRSLFAVATVDCHRHPDLSSMRWIHQWTKEFTELHWKRQPRDVE